MSSSASENFKRGFSLAPITDRESGLKAIKELFAGYLVIAFIQGVIGAFVMHGAVWDGLILAGCAFAMKTWNSRVAAVLLLIISLVMAVTTVATLLGIAHLGGKNVILAAIAVYMGIRSTQVTFALNRMDEAGQIEGEIEEDGSAKAPSETVIKASDIPAPRPKPASMPHAFNHPEGRNIYD